MKILLPCFCKVHVFLFALALFVVYSCNISSVEQDEAYELTDTISFSSFQNTVSVLSQKTGLNFGNLVDDMEVFDSILVLSNYADSNLLSMVSLRSNSIIGKTISRGKSEFECLNIMNIMRTGDPDLFWVFDITQSKFVLISLSKYLKWRDSYRPEKAFTLSEECRGAVSPSWNDDSSFVSCSYYFDDCRFYSFNLQSNLVHKYGRLPVKMKDWPTDGNNKFFTIRATGYPAVLIKKPGEKKYAVMYTTTDRLDIYNFDTLQRVIKGPDLFPPNYSFAKTATSTLPVNTGETRYAYAKAKGTDQFIYTIYSGRKDYNHCGDRILVYDWEGNPVKIIKLGSTYCAFGLLKNSDTSTTVYLINSETGDLEFFSDSTNINNGL